MKSIEEVKKELLNSFFNQSSQEFDEWINSPDIQEELKAYPELLVYSKHHQHMTQIDYSFIQEDSILSSMYNFSLILSLSSCKKENFTEEDKNKAYEFAKKAQILGEHLIQHNPKIEIVKAVFDYVLSPEQNMNLAFKNNYYLELKSKEGHSIVVDLIRNLIENSYFNDFLDTHVLKFGLMQKIEKQLESGHRISQIFSPYIGVEEMLTRVFREIIATQPHNKVLMAYENEAISGQGFKTSILYRIARGRGVFEETTLKNYLNKYKSHIPLFDSRGKNIAYYMKNDEDCLQVLKSYGIEPQKLGNSFSFKKLMLSCAFWKSSENIEKSPNQTPAGDFLETIGYKIKIFNPEFQDSTLNTEAKNVLLQAVGLMSLIKNNTYNEDTHFLKHDVLTSFFGNAKEINDIFKTQISIEEKNMIHKTFGEQLHIIKTKLNSISTHLITNLAASKINDLQLQNKVLTLKAAR